MNCTPKKLYELYNDYPLAPGKIEIKEKILSRYQLKIAHLYNIPIDNVKRLMPNVFDKKNIYICTPTWLPANYLRLQLKVKKMHRVLEFNQAQWIKPYSEFNTQKWKETEKQGDKYGKALYKSISSAVYRKAIENLRNRINVRLTTKILYRVPWMCYG